MLKKLPGIIAVFILAACSRSSAGPAPLPEPGAQTPTQTAEIPTGSRSWSFVHDSNPHRYSITASTLLELAGDSGVSKETFETSTDFTIAISGEATPVKVSGLVENLKLSGNGRMSQESNQPFQPFSFSGRIENGALALDSAGGSAFQTVTACDNAGLNAVTALNRSIISLPRAIAAGMTWTDSSTVSGCSGSIPVQLTAIRSYRILGETKDGGPGMIAIDRTDRVRATGEGSQGQHRVLLQANGSGSARILVDRSSGILSGIEGEQKTDVIVTTSGRTQHFVQTVRERTAAR